MMNQKSNRGGRRPGAGRKPRAFPAKTINVKIDEPLVVKFREHCKAAGISQAKMVARWIEEATA